MARTGRSRSMVAVVAGGMLAMTLAVGAVSAADQGVLMEDFAFSPGTVTVTVGDSVTWRNNDEAPHDAVADDASWSTELLSDGQTGSVTFDAAGTYPYTCSIHPTMTGRVVVRAAGSGGGGGGGGGAPSTDTAAVEVVVTDADAFPLVVAALAAAGLTMLVAVAVADRRARRDDR